MAPEIIGTADILQGRLLRYRLENFRKLSPPKIPGDERLRSRDRDLYEALALPIGEDPKACARLLECLEYQQDLNREPLPPKETAALESLFKLIHVQPDQEAYALRDLKKEANRNLAASGEHFRLNEKAVSGALKTFGFLNRKRTNSGWVVLIDRAARKRTHELLSVFGVNSLSACLRSQAGSELCEFCKPHDPSDAKPSLIEQVARDMPADTGAPAPLGSKSCEQSELREDENSANEDPDDHNDAGSCGWVNLA